MGGALVRRCNGNRRYDMKRLMAIGSVLMLAAVTMIAADQTWTGKISDSMCGAKHNTSAEHGGKKMTEHDCTVACVKEHSAKYVFVKGGKVYNIGNQDFGDLEANAGESVKLTGEMKGDTITVSKIEPAGKKKTE
jgi:hypothetical protein